jgi:hypothetical protein
LKSNNDGKESIKFQLSDAIFLLEKFEKTVQMEQEEIQKLCFLAIRIYSEAVERIEETFPPIPATEVLTATEVAVIVNELMLGADLNMFDLAMWASRAR